MSISPALLNRYRIPAEHSLSWVDDLTGLPNRRYLLYALETLVSDGNPFSLLFLDMDGFKEVNDRHGHEEGDRVLALLASLLTGNVRLEDRAVRFGGDEFVVLVPGRGNGVSVADRLLHAVSGRMQKRWGVTASIGEASFPEDASSPETLLRAADRAMYRAKNAGGNRRITAGNMENDLFWHEDVFAGREEETDESLRILRGKANEGVLILGETGSGKSALMDRAIPALSERRLFRLVCRPELAEIPWSSLVSSAREAAGAFELHGSHVREVLARFFPGLFPNVAPMPYRPDTLAVLEALSGLFGTLAPLTFLGDDAQWMDRETASFLGYALRVGIPSGCTLALTAPEDGLDPLRERFPGLDALHRVVLGPLNTRKTGELVRARLGSPEPLADLEARTHRFSGGNPLFACEFLRAGCSPDGGFTGRGLPGDDPHDPVPERVQGILRKRLAGLSSGCLALIRYASADRRESLGLDYLATVSSLSEGEILGFLDDAVKAGVLVPGREALLSYRFPGEAVRLAVYAGAPRSLLLQAHQALARHAHEKGDLLEAARHLETTGDALKAYHAYRDGAERYKDSGLPGEGLACLERAEALAKGLEGEELNATEAFQLKQSLVKALLDCGYWKRARNAMEEAAVLAETLGLAEEAFSLRLTRTDCLRFLGKADRAVEELQRLLPGARGENRVNGLIRLADCLSRVHRAAEALERLEEAESLIHRDPSLSSRFAPHLGHKKLLCAISLNRVDLAFAASEDLLQENRDLENMPWYFLHDLGEYHLLLGRPLTALGLLEKSEQASERQASFYGKTCSLALAVDACFHAHLPRRMETLTTRAEAHAQRMGDQLIPGETALNRARLFLDAGHPELALDVLRRESVETVFPPVASYVRSLALEASGAFREALNALEPSLAAVAGNCLAPIDAFNVTLTREEIHLQKEWLELRLAPSPGGPERLRVFMERSMPRAAFRAAGLLALLLHEDGRTEEADEVLRDSLAREDWKELRRQALINLRLGAAWNPSWGERALILEDRSSETEDSP